MFSLVFSSLILKIHNFKSTDKKINGEISLTIPRLKLTLLFMQVCCYIKSYLSNKNFYSNLQKKSRLKSLLKS